MSFFTVEFIIFFLILLAVYWLLPCSSWQNGLLLLASYLFYGWVTPWIAILLGLSTLADFALVHLLVKKPDARRTWLALSFIVNLGVLAFFKYYGFFGDDLVQTLISIGLSSSALLQNVVLPVGLSFYTLKKLAYMLDVSRRIYQPTTSLVDFALFVSFFPQIVAGPIDRAQLLLPQMKNRRAWSSSWFHAAWPLLITGLFKKLVIADSLKVMVDRVFGIESPSWLLILAATLAFAIQILADFSAYTDLARGIAFLLGFKTSENFAQPYLSLTPTHFWNCWHITLSNWLRDYLFFPLRRALVQHKSPQWLATLIPPLITMFVCGIWHGAGWTFALWGLFHGLLIAGYQLAGLGGSWKPASAVKNALAWMVMFSFTLFGWLLFRAPSTGWLVDLFANAPWVEGQADLVVALIVLSMAIVYSLPLLILTLFDRFPGKSGWLVGGFYALLLVAVIIYINPAPPDFIYFQF